LKFEPGKYELAAGGQALVALLSAAEAQRVRDAACAVVRPGGRAVTFRALELNSGLRRDVDNVRVNATAADMLAAVALAH